MNAEGFAAVPTWMIRDESVSGYAVLVYAALASRAGLRSNIPSQDELAREARCSDKTVRRSLKELEALGVVERTTRRSRSGHRLTDGYRLLSRPIVEGEELPEPSSVRGGLPELESGPTGTQFRAIDREIEIDSNPSIVSPQQLAAAFDAFWACYPRKVGRPTAQKAFDRAVKRAGGPTVVLEGARRLRDDPNLPEKQFIPHPSTWLNRDGWEDEPLPARAGGPGVVETGRRADEILRARAAEQRAIGGGDDADF